MRSFVYSVVIAVLSMSKVWSVGVPPDSLAIKLELRASEFRNTRMIDSARVCYDQAAYLYRIAQLYEKLVDVYNQMGIMLTREDKYDQAREYLVQSVDIARQHLDSNNLTLATTYISLGVVCSAEEKYDDAIRFHSKALRIRLEVLGEMHAEVATSYGNLGNVYRKRGDLDESIKAHSRALNIRSTLFGESGPEITESFVGLGQAFREQKHYDLALYFFEKALANKEIQKGSGHKDLVRYYKYISDVYFLKGDSSRGKDYEEIYKDIEAGSK